MPTTSPRASTRAPILLSIAGLLLVPGATFAQSPVPGSPGAAGCVPGTVGTIDHPTGCADVVLRLDTCCAFTTPENSITEAPTFTLYGDNTVIFRPQPPDGRFPMPGDAWVPMVRAAMTPAQVDALLAFALGPGGLADAQDLYPAPVMDAPSTILSAHAGGVDRQVTVQALGLDDSSFPDAAARARFAELADVLDSFEEQVAAGNVECAEPYEPAAYRGMLTELWEGAPNPVGPWPWTDVALDDFVAPQDSFVRYAELSPQDVAAVTTTPSGGITNIAIEAPDGSRWFLSLRPLLADESLLPAGVTA